MNPTRTITGRFPGLGRIGRLGGLRQAWSGLAGWSSAASSAIACSASW